MSTTAVRTDRFVAAARAAQEQVLKPSEHTPATADWVPRLFEEAGAPAGSIQLAPSDRELGGRDPMVVFADGALSGSFLNAGQACVSTERLYVERPLYDDFTHRPRQRARTLELAPLVLTGERREAEVVEGPLPDEELFAVRRANDTVSGLAASVWTRGLDKAARAVRRIRAGTVRVNDFGYSFATGQAPWGGTKASGFGRTSGRHGLYDCVNVKYVDRDRGRVRPGWRFPYDARTERALRTAWKHRRDLLHLVRRSR